MAKNANGMGSIYQDKNKNCWRGSITLGRDETGRLRRKTFTGRTQKIVKEKMDKFLLENKTEHFLEGSKVKLTDFTYYWFSIYSRKVSEASARGRAFALRNLFENFPGLKDVYVTDITPEFLEKGIYRFMENVGITDFTEYYRAPLTYLLDYGVKKDYFKVNPLKRIDLKQFTKTKTKIKKLAFSQQEKEAFLGELERIYTEKLITVDIYYYPFYLFLFWTGLRAGEACALQWSDVDFENNRISVTKTISHNMENQYIIKQSTKTGLERYVYLHEEALRVLNYIKENEKIFSNDTFVFVQYKDKSRYITHDSLKTYIKHACRNAGITPVTAHFLRHNFISMLVNSGAPVTAVRELAGHKDLKTTLNTYSHSNADMLKDIMDKI